MRPDSGDRGRRIVDGDEPMVSLCAPRQGIDRNAAQILADLGLVLVATAGGACTARQAGLTAEGRQFGGIVSAQVALSPAHQGRGYFRRRSLMSCSSSLVRG